MLRVKTIILAFIAILALSNSRADPLFDQSALDELQSIFISKPCETECTYTLRSLGYSDEATLTKLKVDINADGSADYALSSRMNCGAGTCNVALLVSDGNKLRKVFEGQNIAYFSQSSNGFRDLVHGKRGPGQPSYGGTGRIPIYRWNGERYIESGTIDDQTSSVTSIYDEEYSTANTSAYKDPVEFCKAVRNLDNSEQMDDERYIGPVFPSVVTKAFESEYVTWRCVDGDVYGCYVGASGRDCVQWKNVTLSPTARIREFCVNNPNSFVAYAYNDTPYDWNCHGTVAVIDPNYKNTLLDKRGFVIDNWKKILGTAKEENFSSIKESDSGNDQCTGKILTVPKLEKVCDFFLDAKGILHYKNKKVSDPIVVSYYSDGSQSLADSLIIYPSSPSGRYYYIKACEHLSNGNECWSQWLFDSNLNKFKSTSIGRYGAHPEIYWNSNDRFAALFYSDEGDDQIHILDAETGKTWEFPDWGNHDSNVLDIDKKSFAWIDSSSFSIDAAICKESKLTPSGCSANISSALKTKTVFKIESEKLYPTTNLSNLNNGDVLEQPQLGNNPEFNSTTPKSIYAALKDLGFDIEKPNSQNLQKNELKLSNTSGNQRLMEVLKKERNDLQNNLGRLDKDTCYYSAISAGSVGATQAFFSDSINALAVDITVAALKNIKFGFVTNEIKQELYNTTLNFAIDVYGDYLKEKLNIGGVAINAIEKSIGFYSSILSSKPYNDIVDKILRDNVIKSSEDLSSYYLDELKKITLEENLVVDSFRGNNRNVNDDVGFGVPIANSNVKWIYGPKTHYMAAFLTAKCEPDITKFLLIRFEIEKSLFALGTTPKFDTVEIFDLTNTSSTKSKILLNTTKSIKDSRLVINNNSNDQVNKVVTTVMEGDTNKTPSLTDCGSKWYQRLGLQFLEIEQAIRGGYSFNTACQAHDACYGDCKISKSECDTKLLSDAEETCKNVKNSMNCNADAQLFFQAVSEKGDTAFNQARATCPSSNKIVIPTIQAITKVPTANNVVNTSEEPTKKDCQQQFNYSSAVTGVGAQSALSKYRFDQGECQ